MVFFQQFRNHEWEEMEMSTVFVTKTLWIDLQLVIKTRNTNIEFKKFALFQHWIFLSCCVVYLRNKDNETLDFCSLNNKLIHFIDPRSVSHISWPVKVSLSTGVSILCSAQTVSVLEYVYRSGKLETRFVLPYFQNSDRF